MLTLSIILALAGDAAVTVEQDNTLIAHGQQLADSPPGKCTFIWRGDETPPHWSISNCTITEGTPK